MTFPEMNTELLELIYTNPWLTPNERRVFELKYREDMSYHQIAREVNCSVETVGRILKKTYRKTEPIIIEYYKNHPNYCNDLL